MTILYLLGHIGVCPDGVCGLIGGIEKLPPGNRVSNGVDILTSIFGGLLPPAVEIGTLPLILF